MKQASKTKKKPAAKKPLAPKKSPPPKVAAKKGLAELQDFIHASLDSDKAQDIVSINLKGKTAIADFMLIATGTSSRHVAGIAHKLSDKLSAERKIKARLEGLETGDWVIVDAGDVIVHLFRDEVRKLYNLEKLWGADFSTVHYTLYHSV
jgi:ribosome silencing factor RsfS/YbeB/iojap